MALEYRKLSDDELVAELALVDGWRYDHGQITKSFSFEAYLDGPAFAMRVGEVAEALNHHPDIVIGWRKVKVSVNTHDVDGLSPYDFELARRIDAL